MVYSVLIPASDLFFKLAGLHFLAVILLSSWRFELRVWLLLFAIVSK